MQLIVSLSQSDNMMNKKKNLFSLENVMLFIPELKQFKNYNNNNNNNPCGVTQVPIRRSLSRMEDAHSTTDKQCCETKYLP